MIKLLNLKLGIAILIIVSCLILPSCNNGTIRITNTTQNPYALYIDNELKVVLTGNTYEDYSLPEGAHEIRVKQNSGYLIYPTEKSTVVTVKATEDIEWTF